MIENAPSPKYFSSAFLDFSNWAVGSTNSILWAGVNAREDAKPDVAVPDNLLVKFLSVGALTINRKGR
jgi:hypothetical protein